MLNQKPLLGVDYYPEHWSESRWAQDARMMREGGLQVVRVAEFAWSKLEPRAGAYDFTWLDRAIEILAAEQLRVVLGTPTAAPPAWMVRAHPEILPVDVHGHRRDHGSRCHYCHTSATYRDFARRIVSAMAEQYGNHPAVIGWQIDNEFGCHDSARCYCGECTAAFRVWLEQKYQSLDALNDAWGNVFWSQTYGDWSQINLPNRTQTEANPSHVLDYDRFASEQVASFSQLQVSILRERAGTQFITTNCMADFSQIDYAKLAAPLDFISWDSYPTGYAERVAPAFYMPDAARPQLAFDVGDPYITGFGHALIAGLKPGVPFWVMEQQCGNVNWGTYNPAPRPGAVRLWTWHALAAGADTVVYFRWRACLYAQEQLHSGLLRHDGAPAQGYRDVLALEADQPFMDELRTTPMKNEAAILVSYQDLWAFNLQPHNQDLTYWRHLFLYYSAMLRAGVPCDIVSPESDLSNYKVVVAPTLWMPDQALAARLRAYVEQGGVLALGVRSGFKTPTNRVTDEPLPGALRELVGATVETWQSLPPGISLPVRLVWRDGETVDVCHWAEALTPHTAETLAFYNVPYFEAQAAMTWNAVGKGRAAYIGWFPDAAQADEIVAMLCERAQVRSNGAAPEGVILARRADENQELIVAMNFTDRDAGIKLNGSAWRDVLTSAETNQTVTIPARSVRVFARK
jgi:beta-galactosidase